MKEYSKNSQLTGVVVLYLNKRKYKFFNKKYNPATEHF